MISEKQLQDYTKKQARLNGVLFYKLQAVGQRGFPDIMLVHEGQIVFIELKSPRGTGRLSELQKLTISLLRGEGAAVYVVDKKETIDTIITELVVNGAASRHR